MENAVRVSTEGIALNQVTFSGWNAPDPLTYDQWCQKLIDEYNKADPNPPPKKYVHQVIGYPGQARFFDVNIVAMGVFDLRTGAD